MQVTKCCKNLKQIVSRYLYNSVDHFEDNWYDYLSPHAMTSPKYIKIWRYPYACIGTRYSIHFNIRIFLCDVMVLCCYMYFVIVASSKT